MWECVRLHGVGRVRLVVVSVGMQIMQKTWKLTLTRCG